MADSKKAVRTERWRAVDERRGWELYDMKNDPNQLKNLAKEEPRRLAKLREQFEAWFTEATSNGFDTVPIHVGHEGQDEIVLEGHYAYLHPFMGTRPNPKIHGVTYHGPAGWANDWVDNWTSTNSYPY